ncbi:MAG TPA: hypothetical protein VFN24_06325 [Microbacterium sp.]|nr:hypothetical protein [Microbacterium sp.]
MDDDGLLALIYRSRPSTIAELATVAHLDHSEVVTRISRLQERGAVSVHAGLITCPHPGAWAARVIEDQTGGLRESASAAAAQIERIVEQLPALLSDWSVGEASGDVAPIFARHGPHAAEDLWYEISRESSGSAWGVFPNVERFQSTDPARAARFGAAFAGKQSVRGLLPKSVLEDARLVAMAQRYAEAGVDFRVLDDLPSWFWIDGDILALPFEWGEGWPTSILGVRSAPLAALGRTLYDALWRRSEAIGVASRPWTPLLQHMRRGITLDSASRALGINPRTGRRRVAAAMEHYGVSTLFALGVAWAADADRPEGA